MKFNKIISILIITILTFSFIACDGKSDASFSNDENNESSETLINIDVNCTTPATVSEYITLNSGDLIVEDDSAVVNIYHDANETKKVCLVSGTAHILRK